MIKYRNFLVIFLLCSLHCITSDAQNTPRFKITKIYNSSKVFIGSHPLRVGDRFDFDGVIQWNDSVKCVCIDDYKRGKSLTISPYIQKSGANNNISELIYKSSEDSTYIVTPGKPVQLDIRGTKGSTFLFHETDANRAIANDFELFPVNDSLTLTYEMFKNRIGLLSCEIVEVTEEFEIKEYPIKLLILEKE